MRMNEINSFEIDPIHFFMKTIFLHQAQKTNCKGITATIRLVKHNPYNTERKSIVICFIQSLCQKQIL